MDSPRRILVGFGLLAALWVAVYWWYEPRDPPLTFAPVPSSYEGDAPDDPPPGARPTPRTDTGPEQAAQPRADTGPAPGETGPRLEAPRFKEHAVRRGETLQSIARREYGSAALWVVISRANPFLRDPNRIAAGTVIRVPLDPGNVQGRVVDGSGEEAERPAPPEPEEIVYEVRSGDTLSEIAQAFYGSAAPRYLDLIFEANRDVLRDMDSLRVGQKLRIPPAPSGAG
jgi:nucleoid-associated protein YgaU